MGARSSWLTGAPHAQTTRRFIPVVLYLPEAVAGAQADGERVWVNERQLRGVIGDSSVSLKCPLGAHARRMNPRDAAITGVARLHRVIRRSTSYGPMLPKGVLEDDGADRGIIFVAAMANLERQFEFVKTQWVNQGVFFGAPDEKDPLVGPNDGGDQFTIPRRPIRRRLTDVPAFVVNRGGEYCFIPSLSALRWLTELDT